MNMEQLEKRKHNFDTVADMMYIIDRKLNILPANTGYNVLAAWYKKLYGKR